MSLAPFHWGLGPGSGAEKALPTNWLRKFWLQKSKHNQLFCGILNVNFLTQMQVRGQRSNQIFNGAKCAEALGRAVFFRTRVEFELPVSSLESLEILRAFDPIFYPFASCNGQVKLDLICALECHNGVNIASIGIVKFGKKMSQVKVSDWLAKARKLDLKFRAESSHKSLGHGVEPSRAQARLSPSVWTAQST